MKEVIETLDKLNDIYNIKLTKTIELLEKIDITNDKFDSLLDLSAKLMSLKLQSIDFKNRYEESKNIKEEK